MKISKYQKRKLESDEKKAIILYKQGLTTREVGNIVGKSHTWVWNLVKEKLPDATAVDNSTLDKNLRRC